MLRDPLQELHCTTFNAQRAEVTAYPLCLEYHLKRGRCINCGRHYTFSPVRLLLEYLHGDLRNDSLDFREQCTIRECGGADRTPEQHMLKTHTYDAGL